jgi:hypothetical protein
MTADEMTVWNRAALQFGGASPREKDAMLSALLAVHGLIMNGVAGLSAECREVVKAADPGKVADTRPIQDTLDRTSERPSVVDVALAKVLERAAEADRSSRRAAGPEARTPARGPAGTRAKDDLAVAIRLAAEAGQ